MSSMEATRRITATGEEALAAGRKVQVSVQSAFGCGFEGPVDEGRVLNMARTYVEAGLYNISLADTAGHAHPARVERLFGTVMELDPRVECTCHFHNTYGLGMANIFAALRAGVTSFETSFAGLGGCPFTRVAAGNVATEDFVNALQIQGMREDIDLEALIGVGSDVAGFFERELPGCVYKTGKIEAREPA
jgi:hydroxymethylglutaryl-CoA lyase